MKTSLKSDAVEMGTLIDGARFDALDLDATHVRLYFHHRDVRVEIVGSKGCPPDRVAPQRDELGPWSDDSRKRLLWVVNNCAINWATLLTLTYPETWPIVGRTSQRHLANLIRSMKREWPDLLYLWVREYQTRGAQHFHVLLTCFGHGLPDLRYRSKAGEKGKGPWGWKREHRWVSRRWQESIANFGSRAGYVAGCRWELLESPDGGARYVSQYASKREQKTVPEWVVLPGRWWGHSRDVRVPFECPQAVVPLREYLRYVQGPAATEDGWLFSLLHNGRERAHRWLPPSGPANPELTL